MSAHPPAWPLFPDLLPRTAHTYDLARRVVFSEVLEEHSLFLLLSCASVSVAIRSGILTLPYSARPFTICPCAGCRTDGRGVKVEHLAHGHLLSRPRFISVFSVHCLSPCLANLSSFCLLSSANTLADRYRSTLPAT